MSDKFGFFDPYFRSNGPFSFFGRDMSLDPKPDPDAGSDPNSPLELVVDRMRSNSPLADTAQPSDGDVNALARMMFGEGAGLYKVPGAMEGIGWAARNRVGAPGHPDTLQGVINQPDKHGQPQFQAVGNDVFPGNKEWQLSADPSQLVGPDVDAYQRAQDVARGILTGDIPDPTGGATSFRSHHEPPPAGGYPLPDGYVNTSPALGTPSTGYFIFLKPKPAGSR